MDYMYRCIPYDKSLLLLKYFYPTDKEFYTTMHQDANYCVDLPIQSSHQVLTSTNTKTYVVMKNRKLVAYFGKGFIGNENHLIGFFIHPKYRKDKRNIFNSILINFNLPIRLTVFIKNRRCIKFLLNNNFTIDKMYTFNFLQLVRRK